MGRHLRASDHGGRLIYFSNVYGGAMARNPWQDFGKKYITPLFCWACVIISEAPFADSVVRSFWKPPICLGYLKNVSVSGTE